MRFKRLSHRFQWAGLCASLFMLGMFVGRVSIKNEWMNWVAVASYVFTCSVYFLPLYRQYKRDEQQFREAMRQLENEIRDR